MLQLNGKEPVVLDKVFDLCVGVHSLCDFNGNAGEITVDVDGSRLVVRVGNAEYPAAANMRFCTLGHVFHAASLVKEAGEVVGIRFRPPLAK